MGTIKAYKENLDNKISEKDKLSLLLGKDSFFYALFDQYGRLKEYFRAHKGNDRADYFQWLEETWKDIPIFQDQEVFWEIGLLSPYFTLVPVSLYEEKSKYLQFYRATRIPAHFKVWTDSVTTRDYIKILYGVNPNFYQFFQRFEPEVRVRHVFASLISRFYRQFAIDQEWAYLSHLRGNHMILLLFKEGKLVFTNYYNFQKDEDIYYYIALTINQLELDPYRINLFLSGEWYAKTARYKWLRKKFNSIQFANPDSHLLAASSQRHNLVPHELFDLVSITE